MRVILLACFLISLLQANIFTFATFLNSNNCDQVINKTYFNVCYSYKHKAAIAVNYTLDGELVNKTNIKERMNFYNEKTIPMAYRAKYSDYTHSGYDRGHMASDSSFDFDEKALRKTYSLANIVPQSPILNRKIWLKAERYERLVAVKLKKVNVLNLIEYSNDFIGNGVGIPNKFYKILWSNDNTFKKCFGFSNDKEQQIKDLKYYEVNCEGVFLKQGARYD